MASDGDGRGRTRRERDARANGHGGRGGITNVARLATEQLGAITGRRAEFVSRMERSDDDGWHLTVEVVEVERIPDTTSVMGSYDVVVDADGNLVEYSRSRRYLRSQSDQWEV